MEVSRGRRMHPHVPTGRWACAQSNKGNDRRGRCRTFVERSVHGATRRARRGPLRDPTGPHGTNPLVRAGIPPLSAPLLPEYSRSVEERFPSLLGAPNSLSQSERDRVTQRVAGSMPFAMITAAASGVCRKSTNVFDAASFLVPRVI